MVASAPYLSPFYLALGVCLYGAFSLARASVSLGLVERPLVVAFIWGVLTGDLAVSLSLGVCCELFWIDDLTVGTRVCITGTLPLLLTLVLINLSEFGDFPADPQHLCPVLCCTMPLAWCGARGESLVRRFQVREHTLFVEKRKGEAVPGYIFLVILGRLFIIQTAIFCILLALLAFIFFGYQRFTGSLPVMPAANWYILWSIAAIGGICSLRAKRAYGVFAASLLALFLTFFNLDVRGIF